MKKSWMILAVIILFSASLVRAEITLDGPGYSAYNLGDRLSLSANVVYPNNVNGFLKASLACDTTTIDYYLVPIELSAGVAKRVQISDLSLQEGYTGNCHAVVELLNNQRQSLARTQTGTLLITDSLRLDAKLDKLNVEPGATVELTGSVRNARGERLANGDVKITLDDEYFTNVKDGVFGYELKLPADYKSGNHNIDVIISDAFGNKAESNYTFNVKAIATKLETKINQDNFNPKDLATMQTFLYDQAGEKMDGEIAMKLYDVDDKLVLQRTADAGEQVEYTLPDYAKPGNWRLDVSSSGLSETNELNVQVVEKVDFVVNDQKVILTNVGNVVYNKPIELLLSDGNKITKQTSLKPGETAIIDLSKEDIASGDYNIQVSSGDSQKAFDNVGVDHTGKNAVEKANEALPGTGRAVLGTADDPIVNPYYAAVAGVGASLVSYLGYRQWKRRARITDKVKAMQVREGEKMAMQIKSKKEKLPAYKYGSERDKEKELMEYRDRLLANIEKEKREMELKQKRAAVQSDYGYKISEPSHENEGETFNFTEPSKADAEEEDFTLDSKKKKNNDDYFNMFGES